jgi:DNA-binding NarL/FixJ family response regulator
MITQKNPEIKKAFVRSRLLFEYNHCAEKCARIDWVLKIFFIMLKNKKKLRNMLTTREKEVLELLSRGLSRYEIAGILFVSPETVKKHLSNAYKKLEVNNKITAFKKMKWL